MTLPFGLLLLVFSVSYLGTFVVRWWAIKKGLMDIPNERSSHSQPTPRGGGLPIIVGTLGGGFLYAWFNPGCSWSALLSYIAGAIVVATVSWFDDWHSLPKLVRLTAYSVVALLALWGLGYWGSVAVPFFGQLHLGWLGLLVTFLWIVGMINAYNFMDGIDGIAGGQAVLAGLGWAVLGWLNSQPFVYILGLLVATSSLGFLGHNWPPGRIFMGDVGSTFLGYTFAVLPVIAAQNDSRLALAGVLLVWPFVFDTVFTFLRRLRNGENVFIAHRSHLYQRLVIAGYTHRFVTILYIGLSVIGAILAWAWFQNGKWSALTVALITPMFCLGLWMFVNLQEHRNAIQPSPRVQSLGKPHRTA